MTGNRKGAEKITGDIFATIIETKTKYCTTHLLTNDKGVDRSSPGKVDHYSSEDRLGSRVRKKQSSLDSERKTRPSVMEVSP